MHQINLAPFTITLSILHVLVFIVSIILNFLASDYASYGRKLGTGSWHKWIRHDENELFFSWNHFHEIFREITFTKNFGRICLLLGNDWARQSKFFPTIHTQSAIHLQCIIRPPRCWSKISTISAVNCLAVSNSTVWQFNEIAVNHKTFLQQQT